MKKKKKQNAIVRFWRYYILGHDHCDSCPYAWSEYSAGCEEWDSGCIIKGECADDGCRLLPPFRAVIGWVRKKQRDYYIEHEYDDYGDFYEQEEAEKKVLGDSIKKHILLHSYLRLYRLTSENEPVLLDDESIERLYWDALWRVKSEYEDFAHPIVHKTLRQEWRELIKKTVDAWLRPLRPFLPERRGRKHHDQ